MVSLRHVWHCITFLVGLNCKGFWLGIPMRSILSPGLNSLVVMVLLLPLCLTSVGSIAIPSCSSSDSVCSFTTVIVNYLAGLFLF